MPRRHQRSGAAARRLLVASVAAVAALASLGLLLAIGIGSAGADQTVTLGSVAGSPTMNICPAGGANCTYVPFSGVSPALQVPFDGTVTSFSVNAGSAGGTVELRVLRPANGQFTGAGTGPAETIANPSVNTFAVNIPVSAGDVLALDNASSALLFDTGPASSTSVTFFYEPALADGQTAAPNNTQSGTRLLLSATVQSAATTGTAPGTGVAPGTPPVSGGSTPTTLSPSGTITAPTLSHVGESHRRLARGQKAHATSRLSNRWAQHSHSP